jgi:hypothetical protein
MAKAKRLMGIQQILLSPDAETQALLEYLCQQSGKLYNSGLYFARQLFFKTGKLLTGKFDLAYEPSNNFRFWILDFGLRVASSQPKLISSTNSCG